mmetsp:Transcript_17780/g.58183  ORF Transcript_17780/g.58183 Transcript_17780/m.58183 type:complete len:222 (+) Transcript_17780:2455-3120(+)
MPEHDGSDSEEDAGPTLSGRATRGGRSSNLSSAAAGASTSAETQQRNERNKEWAALTTWLRMNLHQPRTAKRKVLFIGKKDPANGIWTFALNPNLTWDEVSIETKQRLGTLMDEVVTAFVRKYPSRPVEDWTLKLCKYKIPGDFSKTHHKVPLKDVVDSLCRLYAEHEGAAAAAAPHNPVPVALPPSASNPVQLPSLDGAAATAAPAQAPLTAGVAQTMHA